MRFVRSAAAAAVFVAAGMAVPALAQGQSSTLDAVRARGQLNCSVSPSTAGFSLPDSQGVWRGIDVDYCRAVAAAIFGDGNKVRLVPSTTVQRFPMLQSGEVPKKPSARSWPPSRPGTRCRRSSGSARPTVPARRPEGGGGVLRGC